MKEDEARGPLSLVRDHVRGERTHDAALEALARGEASSPSVAELEERSGSDAEVAAMLEASRPFGPEVLDRIAARVTANASAIAVPSARPPVVGGRVLAFVRRHAAIVAPLAVAAAVLLYMGRADEAHLGLPDYFVVATGEREMRGADQPHATLELRGGANASFEIVARPATTVPTPVVAYLFAIGDGEPNPIEAKVEIAAEGSVRIKGSARALAGARELRLVLGPASDFKRYEDALSRARAGTSDGQVRVLVVPILRIPRAGE